MSLKCEIEFRLNGAPRRVAVPVDMSALTMLREVVGLTGAKYGCGEGECGACTIIIDGRSLNSCLMFAVDCDGREVTTVEGLAVDEAAQPLLDAFTDSGAVQCGFCTPGLVVQSKYVLDTDPHADRARIKRGIEGNICRCTGYKKIVDAVASLSGAND
ncbi:MAG: (2Fe-2S)-binding protein [Sphingomonadales bacterium]